MPLFSSFADKILFKSLKSHGNIVKICSKVSVWTLVLDFSLIKFEAPCSLFFLRKFIAFSPELWANRPRGKTSILQGPWTSVSSGNRAAQALGQAPMNLYRFGPGNEIWFVHFIFFPYSSSGLANSSSYSNQCRVGWVYVFAEVHLLHNSKRGSR